MALSPEEKRRLDAILREAEEDIAKAAAIDEPTTAKEVLDVFGTALGQSASMNLLDEAVATYGGLTPEERAEANKAIEEARNRTLGTAAAGLAGDIVGAIPAGIGAARLAGGKALKLLGLGAAEGAISGAGAGETPEERLIGGAIGGGLGLGTGAAGIVGGKVLRSISSEKQMTEGLEKLAREQAEEQIRKEAAKAGSEKLAKEAAPTRFKVEEEKVPEKPAEIIPEKDIADEFPEVDIPDVNEGYQLALERFKPVTTAEKTDGPILIKAGLAPLQTPSRLPVDIESAVDTGYAMSSVVGKGSYGTVYRVVDQKGQPKVAKVSQDPDLNEPEFKATLKHEKDLANEITRLRKSANREEQKYLRHFPKFERVLENPLDPTGGYLIVMDELRPMNDYELAALFKGRSYLEDTILKLKNPYGLDPVTNVIRSTNDFTLPSSHKLRRPLTEVDYENMPLNVRKFYKALEWLADEKDIKWDDLYDSNVMIDPKTGEYVAVDLGQFTLKGRKPPTATSTGTVQKSLGGPGLDTRKRAEEAAGKERQRFRIEEIESLPSEIPTRGATAGKTLPELDPPVSPQLSPRTEFRKAAGERADALARQAAELELARRPERFQNVPAPIYSEARRRFNELLESMSAERLEKLTQQNLDNELQRYIDTVAKEMQRGPEQQTALDLAREIAAQGIEEIASGKPRGMVRLPFGRKKQKELPATTETQVTTAMVPSLSKEEMELAKGPGMLQKTRKLGRDITGSLELDEFRAERKLLEDDAAFADKQLDLATTDAEIRAAERAQNVAYAKLNNFINEYPDIDDLIAALEEINRRQINIDSRNVIGERYQGKKSAETLTSDEKELETDKNTLADIIDGVFERYPELRNELPDDHPLVLAFSDMPQPEAKAFAESRGLLGKIEESLGLKKKPYPVLIPRTKKKRSSSAQKTSDKITKAKKESRQTTSKAEQSVEEESALEQYKKETGLLPAAEKEMIVPDLQITKEELEEAIAILEKEAAKRKK